MRIAYANDPSQIEGIDSVVHDCFFDADDISFDSDASVLSIGFRREALDKSKMLKRGWLLKTWQIPVIECLLKFYNVINYEIEDNEGVGRYNLLELEYDPQQRRIVVKTGIPIHIEMTVGKLEVVVEETDKILDLKIIRSPFDIRNL